MLWSLECSLFNILGPLKILFHLLDIDLLQGRILFILDHVLEDVQSCKIVIVGLLPIFISFGGDSHFSKVSDLLTILRQVRHW